MSIDAFETLLGCGVELISWPVTDAGLFHSAMTPFTYLRSSEPAAGREETLSRRSISLVGAAGWPIDDGHITSPHNSRLGKGTAIVAHRTGAWSGSFTMASPRECCSES